MSEFEQKVLRLLRERVPRKFELFAALSLAAMLANPDLTESSNESLIKSAISCACELENQLEQYTDVGESEDD